jgi:hypothetical protein
MLHLNKYISSEDKCNRQASDWSFTETLKILFDCNLVKLKRTSNEDKRTQIGFLGAASKVSWSSYELEN